MRLSILVLLFSLLAANPAHAGFIGSRHHSGFNFDNDSFTHHADHGDHFAFYAFGPHNRFWGSIIDFYSSNRHGLSFSHRNRVVFVGHNSLWSLYGWNNPWLNQPIAWIVFFKQGHGFILDIAHGWHKNHGGHWHHDDDGDVCQWNCPPDPSFPPASVNNVPEPGLVMLLLISSLMMVAYKKRYLPAAITDKR